MQCSLLFSDPGTPHLKILPTSLHQARSQCGGGIGIGIHVFNIILFCLSIFLVKGHAGATLVHNIQVEQACMLARKGPLSLKRSTSSTKKTPLPLGYGPIYILWFYILTVVVCVAAVVGAAVLAAPVLATAVLAAAVLAAPVLATAVLAAAVLAAAVLAAAVLAAVAPAGAAVVGASVGGASLVAASHPAVMTARE